MGTSKKFTPKVGQYFYRLVRLGGGRQNYIIYLKKEDEDVEISRHSIMEETYVKDEVKKLNGWTK